MLNRPADDNSAALQATPDNPLPWPPALTTAEPGSFPHHTIQIRQPANIREVITLNDFPAPIVAGLEALNDEIVAGRLRGLEEEAADRAAWDQATAPHLGRSWLDIPWYFAEAYLFRRVLEATGYFQAGPWQGFDPYAVKKQAEWQPGAAPAAVETLLAEHAAHTPQSPASPESLARCRRLLHASLWGNRTDLSYAVSTAMASAEAGSDQSANLLADDSRSVVEFLAGRPGATVVLIADNAGTELASDLALIDHLLASGMAVQVRLHLKPQPFFVSDAMARDVAQGLAALPAGGKRARQLAQRLWGWLDAGRLRLETHWFYASSLFYFQMPDDLARRLSQAGLVIVKGDANYRRLAGDARWPFTTRFADVVNYFPAPLAALRTLKAPLMLGLPAAQAGHLDATDPEWLVNGRRGVIQCRLSP